MAARTAAQARVAVAGSHSVGEGSQTETIQALRLGADDYVRKEDVEHELADRLLAVVEANQLAAQDELLARGPTLIAVPLKRYLAAADPVPRVKRMLELYEAALRFGALLILAGLKQRDVEPPAAERLSIRSLMSPTMGAWQHVCAVAGRLLPESSPGWRLAASFETKQTERIIKTRNDLAHSGDPSDTVARELLRHTKKASVDCCANCATFLEISLFRPDYAGRLAVRSHGGGSPRRKRGATRHTAGHDSGADHGTRIRSWARRVVARLASRSGRRARPRAWGLGNLRFRWLRKPDFPPCTTNFRSDTSTSGQAHANAALRRRMWQATCEASRPTGPDGTRQRNAFSTGPIRSRASHTSKCPKPASRASLARCACSCRSKR